MIDDQTFFDWLNMHGVFFEFFIWSPVALLIGGLVGLITARFGRISEKEKLLDPTSRPGAIARYRVGWSESYLAAITRLMDWSERVYGPGFSAQSFHVSLKIAFLYPFFAVVLNWATAGSGSLGGVSFIGDGMVRRPLALLILTVGTPGAVWLARNRKWATQSALEKLLGKVQQTNSTVHSFRYKTLRFIITVAIVWTYIVLFVLALGVFVFLIELATVPLLTSGLSALLVFLFWVTRSTTPAILLFTLFSLMSLISIEIASIWLVFFAVLPLLNTLADYTSVGITRSFLSKVAIHSRERGGPNLPRVFLQVALDLFAAALCLAGLIGAIITALEFWSAIAPNTLLFDWRTYWADIRLNPTDGTALYLMCLTTLIPTIIHVVAGLGAILTHRSRLMHRVADRLDALPGAPDLNDIDDALSGLRTATFWGYATATVVTLIPLIIVFNLLT